jgi:hypothetical protein
MFVMNRRPDFGERQEEPLYGVRRNIVIAQNRVEGLFVVSLQGSLRDADGPAGEGRDLVDRGFGCHDESDDIPAQNGRAIGGDHSVAAHDAKVRGAILDRLGARRQIGDVDEFNVDARMICLSDRSESRDEAIGRAAGRTGRYAEVRLRRPEIDSRDEGRRDDQEACGQKQRGAQLAIPTMSGVSHRLLEHFPMFRKPGHRSLHS